MSERQDTELGTLFQVVSSLRTEMQECNRQLHQLRSAVERVESAQHAFFTGGVAFKIVPTVDRAFVFTTSSQPPSPRVAPADPNVPAGPLQQEQQQQQQQQSGAPQDSQPQTQAQQCQVEPQQGQHHHQQQQHQQPLQRPRSQALLQPEDLQLFHQQLTSLEPLQEDSQPLRPLELDASPGPSQLRAPGLPQALSLPDETGRMHRQQQPTAHFTPATPTGRIDDSDAPKYSLSRTITTVNDLWREWTEGIEGKPPLLSLEQQYQHRWRSMESREKTFYNRRKLVYQEIKERALREGVTEEEAVRQLESFRAIERLSLHRLAERLRGQKRAR